jgi:hypothetical protein
MILFMLIQNSGKYVFSQLIDFLDHQMTDYKNIK